MKIAITGINSALGKAITDSLRGHTIIGLDRRDHPEYRTVRCDFRQGTPPLPAVDVCLHLAFITDPTICEERWQEAYQVNVLATTALVKAAARFVFVSTGFVYGFQEGLLREDFRPQPVNAYARMKCEAEEVVARHPNAVVLRYFYPYGPATKPDSLVNRLIERIRFGVEVDLHEGGRPRVNPLYISDLVEATRRFCLGTWNGVWNVAGTEVVSIQELAELIGQLLGKQPLYRRTRKAILDMAGDTTKLATVYQPAVALRIGLMRTLRHLLDGEAEQGSQPSRPAA